MVQIPRERVARIQIRLSNSKLVSHTIFPSKIVEYEMRQRPVTVEPESHTCPHWHLQLVLLGVRDIHEYASPLKRREPLSNVLVIPGMSLGKMHVAYPSPFVKSLHTVGLESGWKLDLVDTVREATFTASVPRAVGATLAKGIHGRSS